MKLDCFQNIAQSCFEGEMEKNEIDSVPVTVKQNPIINLFSLKYNLLPVYCYSF